MIKLPTFEITKHIPKIIHQTFPDKTKLPLELRENIKKIRDNNPGWVYCLYDDTDIEDFILEYYNLAVLQVYRKINPSYGAARADLFRYLLIYAKGGVYLDIKSSITRPLDESIVHNDQYILSHWEEVDYSFHRELKSTKGLEYQQWHIIAVRGHPFLREVIKRVINNINQYNVFKFGVGRKGVLRLTGPIPYTLAIEKVIHFHSFRKVSISNDFGFIYNIYLAIGNKKGHVRLFKTHYSKLKSRIVISNHFKNYCLLTLFYIMLIIKYPFRKFLKLYRKAIHY